MNTRSSVMTALDKWIGERISYVRYEISPGESGHRKTEYKE